MSDEILDVDLLAFEQGNGDQRRAVVDGVTRSLTTGFVYTSHDVSDDLLDTAYGMLKDFFERAADEKQQFAAPGANGQTGYTGLLVETAATSDKPDWKEMLNWSTPIAPGHPLKRRFPTAYPDQVLPESAVPGITFGLAFCEASGECLVRCSGTDADMIALAQQNALAIGAGHSFILFLGDGFFPINVLNAVQQVPEVCGIFCATANPTQVIVIESEQGRGIVGVIDGHSPKGIEGEEDIAWRKGFLRQIGYKL